MSTDPTTDRERATAFARRLHAKLADRIVPFRWGSAYLEDDQRLRYGSNFLWVDGSPSDATAGELAGQADRILGGAGLQHRIVAVDDPVLSDRLADGFGDLGWSRIDLVLMVLPETTKPGRPPAGTVHPVDHAASLELLLQLQHTYEPPRSPAAMEALAAYPAKLERTVGARFFAAQVEGRLVSIADLYIDATEAQIESVNTLPEFRNRGLATAVMAEAIHAARAAGANWIHLYAEARDWPRDWYERLGFEPAGSYTQFQVFPDR